MKKGLTFFVGGVYHEYKQDTRELAKNKICTPQRGEGEVKMKKLYVDGLKKVMGFDMADMPVYRNEETDRIVANTQEDYDWLVAFDEAVEFLEGNFEKTDYINEISGYNDYISVAEEKRLVAKIWDECDIEGSEDGGIIVKKDYKVVHIFFDNEDIREYLIERFEKAALLDPDKQLLKGVEEWTDEEVADEYSRREEAICKCFIGEHLEEVVKTLEFE